jgi:DNA invertase Pin-like site-specific DNA recombinase
VVTSALDVAGNAQAQGNQKRNRKYKPTGRRTKDKPLTKLQSEAVEMLNRCGANKTEAAKRLGITRQGLDAHLAAVKRRGDLALSRSVNCRRQLPTDSRGQLQVSGK